MRSLFSRLVGSVAILAAVLVLNFFLFRIMPGDPVSSIVDPRFSPAISAVESSKGLYCFRSHNAWGWGSSSWNTWAG